MSVATRFIYWWLSTDGGQAFSPPVRALTLADFDRTGLTLAEYNGVPVLALLTAEVPGTDLYNGGSGGAGLLDGSLRLNADTVVGRVRVRDSGARIPLGRSGGTDIDDILPDVFPDAVLHFQTLDGVTTAPFVSASNSFAQFNPIGTPAIPDGIADGDRFIVAISYTPAVVTTNALLWNGDAILWGTDRLTWN